MDTGKRGKKSKAKLSVADKMYLGIVYSFLALFTLSILYPLIYMVSCSFSSAESLVRGQVFFLPVNPTLQGYKAVFSNDQVWSGYFNSIVYTVTGTIAGVVVTFIGAFVLSRREFPLRDFITVLFLVTMFFNGGILPTYILIKNMGLYNTIWAIILPGAFSVWLAIVGRTFIKSTIPEELYEATSIDGGNYIQYLTMVILPLSKPILAVIALNYAVGHWNSYFNALMYLKDSDKFPLQIILRNIVIANIFDPNSINSTDVKTMIERQYLVELLKYSLIIVSSAPLLIVYPFIQKYFIKGVMIGAIKG
ncbi:MAG: carbohydrate ABC transporter permease [Bacillota bacterium]